ncbi:FkbM family methyltransferase, partial [Geminocystis sp. CENA526]|uniref:FkbM family methyltransferase n=1 Tax=Geminocystis sp. CENA526 TaxID=1355871 RepID=UPI003D6E0A19
THKNLIYKLIDNRITRIFRPKIDRFLASTKLGLSLYNLIANQQSPLIRHYLHSQSSKSLYNYSIDFKKDFFVLNFVNGKVNIPLRSEHSGFDWDAALSVLGHDVEVKEVYRIYLCVVTSPRFFDIGANFGTHTALFLANQAEVYSFEPLPQCKAYFFDLCQVNDWEYHNWHEIGLSDKDGIVTLTYPKGQEWLATIGTPIIQNQQKQEYLQSNEIKIACLDNFQLNYKNALLKIDTEGHELSVLNGAYKSKINESFGIVFESNVTQDRDQIMSIANKLDFCILELRLTKLRLLNSDQFIASTATNFFMGSDHSCKILIENWRL